MRPERSWIACQEGLLRQERRAATVGNRCCSKGSSNYRRAVFGKGDSFLLGRPVGSVRGGGCR